MTVAQVKSMLMKQQKNLFVRPDARIFKIINSKFAT